jgi:IclR family pca regulon transcriptional regulator
VQDVTGDSASLTVLDGADIMHLCHLPSKGFFQFGLTAGSRVRAHVSATGQALLAALSEDQLTRYFATAELTRYTARTVTSEEALRARLAEVRDQGYALLVDELDLGITALGITLMIDGVAAGGLSCATQSGYVSPEEFVSTRLPALQQAASTLRAEVRNFPPLLHSLSAQGS